MASAELRILPHLLSCVSYLICRAAYPMASAELRNLRHLQICVSYGVCRAAYPTASAELHILLHMHSCVSSVSAKLRILRIRVRACRVTALMHLCVCTATAARRIHTEQLQLLGRSFAYIMIKKAPSCTIFMASSKLH